MAQQMHTGEGEGPVENIPEYVYVHNFIAVVEMPSAFENNLNGAFYRSLSFAYTYIHTYIKHI